MHAALPKKVMMLGWELPPHNTGGLGVACYGLAKGLSQRGVRINFALPRKLSVNVPFMHVLDHKLQGVQVTAINSLLQAYLTNIKYTQTTNHLSEQELSMYGNSLYEEALRFADMATAWSKAKPHQVIHAHDWMTYPAAIKARKVSGRPFVAHIHATEYDRTGGSVNPQIAELEYQGLNKADTVIAVSEYTKKMVSHYYSVPEKKISVVHNGVDSLEFAASDIRRVFPNDKIVLFVGRLTFQKGVEYFLRAAKRVLVRHPNTVFVVAGHGDMYERLIMESAYLDIAHRVVFTGFLSGDKLRSVYHMADVFVMPSVSEPYGIVALEALAAGTPTIISRQSGVAETVEHVFKVDFWDTKKMAGQINALLEYPELGKVMADHAKREVMQMTWDAAAEKTINVYNQVLS